jgi:hypothetical protein
MELEITMLSKISQTEKDKYYMLSLYFLKAFLLAYISCIGVIHCYISEFTYIVC